MIIRFAICYLFARLILNLPVVGSIHTSNMSESCPIEKRCAKSAGCAGRRGAGVGGASLSSEVSAVIKLNYLEAEILQ